jgi:transposase-like protein
VFLDGLWLKQSWGGEVRNVSLLVTIGVNNVWTAVPTSKVKEVAAMLKAIHAQEDRAAARQKAEQVAVKLKDMKLADAAALVVAGIEEKLFYYAFPREHWRCLRTNNPPERVLR